MWSWHSYCRSLGHICKGLFLVLLFCPSGVFTYLHHYHTFFITVVYVVVFKLFLHIFKKKTLVFLQIYLICWFYFWKKQTHLQSLFYPLQFLFLVSIENTLWYGGMEISFPRHSWIFAFTMPSLIQSPGSRCQVDRLCNRGLLIRGRDSRATGWARKCTIQSYKQYVGYRTMLL